jgi:hypothetical protein
MADSRPTSTNAFRVGEKYTHEEVYRGLEVGNAGGIRPCIGKGGELRRLVVMTSVPTARIASENPYYDRVEGKSSPPGFCRRPPTVMPRTSRSPAPTKWIYS